jgi:hypothetical protein
VEKGYVVDLNFKDGCLISFADQALEDDILITTTSKQTSGVGGFGRDITAEKNNGVWEITESDLLWVS